jgi:hypothetical protein
VFGRVLQKWKKKIVSPHGLMMAALWLPVQAKHLSILNLL